jgi:ribonuclease HII
MTRRQGLRETPGFDHEIRLAALHGGPVAGVDEAGRGPWAGPVVAAAVILDPQRIPAGINDSKALSRRKREELAGALARVALVGVGFAPPVLIDAINIRQATLAAMRDALAALPRRPLAVLVDGRDVPDCPFPAVPLIGGDRLSLSVAAASIVAKATRDRLMAALAAEFPGYGWERNMGYGAKAHAEALSRLGVTPHHRRSFAPVRAALAAAAS